MHVVPLDQRFCQLVFDKSHESRPISLECPDCPYFLLCHKISLFVHRILILLFVQVKPPLLFTDVVSIEGGNALQFPRLTTGYPFRRGPHQSGRQGNIM